MRIRNPLRRWNRCWEPRLVDVERGPVENRYRLNTQHSLVANGLRALFHGERRMPRALGRELGSLLEGSRGLVDSFARGAARAASDIDLFVIVQTLEETVYRVRRRAWQLIYRLKRLVASDPLSCFCFNPALLFLP